MKNKKLLMILAISTIFMATAAFAQEGMVSYWKFDEGSGATASDFVGTSGGDIGGTVTWSTGDYMVNGALSFNGSSTYVEVPDNPSVYQSLEALSISAWIKYEDKSFCPSGSQCRWMIVSKAWDTGDASFHFYINQFNKLNFGVLSTNTDWLYRQTQTTLDYGQWYHVTGVYDQSDSEKIIIYINGERKDTEIQGAGGTVGTLNTHNQPLQIGRYRGGNPWFFHGVMDEVATFDRVLTPEEVQQQYQNGLNGLGYGSQVACVGFDPPMDKTIFVKKPGRVLPLKMYCTDDSGAGYDFGDKPPLVEVDYEGSSYIPGEEEALPAGQGDEGNMFDCLVGDCQFNLQTKNFNGSGEYSIRAMSSDKGKYQLVETPIGLFQIKQ